MSTMQVTESGLSGIIKLAGVPPSCPFLYDVIQ